MRTRGLTAGALALAAATMSCAIGPGDDEATTAPPEPIPLDLSIDRVDIAHGALRLRATMIDGSADVWLTTGDSCGSVDIGRGSTTRSTFVWSLAEDEVVLAMKCDLVARARVMTEAGLVLESVALSVSPEVAAAPSDDESAFEVTISSSGDVTIRVGSGEQAFSHLELVRALLAQTPLDVWGRPFATTVSVGGTELEVEPPVPEPSAEPESESSEVEPASPTEESN